MLALFCHVEGTTSQFTHIPGSLVPDNVYFFGEGEDGSGVRPPDGFGVEKIAIEAVLVEQRVVVLLEGVFSRDSMLLLMLPVELMNDGLMVLSTTFQETLALPDLEVVLLLLALINFSPFEVVSDLVQNII